MKIPIFIILFSLVSISCDSDVYFGYKFTTEELSVTTLISGYVTNYYTDQPVDNVLVRFGIQETFSDVNGYYQLDYLLSEDELRNKMTEISFEKENYFPSQQSAILSNLENTIDVGLKYAAPIIVSTARPYLTPTFLVCQAIIHDYQGLENLESVQVAYHFPTSIAQVYDTVRVDLEFHQSPEYGIGYYQEFRYFIDEEMFYYIEAMDKDGFSSRLLHSIRPNHPDAPIFDPYN